ncbi:MAG: tetratricopeptide repeat protein [Cytophagales bacterium]
MKLKFVTAAVLGMISANVSFGQSIQEGLKLIDMEQYGNAEKMFKDLVDKNPLSAENQYYLGDYYLKIAQLDTTNEDESIAFAKAAFVKGKQLDPKFALNYVGLGAVKYLTNNWDSATVYFDQATKMTRSKNATVFFKIGEAYLYKGAKNASVAVPQLEKAQSLDGKNTDIVLALGDAYLLTDRGAGSRAVRQYNMALSLNPKLAKAHIKGGKIYLQARNYTEALSYYDKGIEADPSYSPAYRERAELYFKFVKFRDRAASEYKKYLSMSDGNYKTKFRFAFFCFTVGDYESAVEQLKELYQINPNDRILLRLDAYCNYEVGKAEKDSVKATANYSSGLASISKFVELTNDTNKLILLDYEYYGKLLTKNGNDTLGAEYIAKVVGKDSSRFELLFEVAKGFSDKKKHKNAAFYYSKYYVIKKPGANDYLNWGRAYFNAEDYVQADTIFSALVRFKPEEPLGYKWKALSNSRQDKEAKSGIAVPHYEKFIEVATTKDALKYKNDIISGYTYIGKYYLNVKNIAKSKEAWKKILALDPADPNATMVMKSLEAKK